jgi:hypothetical protein
MHATFFLADPDEAGAVASVDDLPDGPIGESLALSSPASLRRWAEGLAASERPAIEPLRDATCRSFPVWTTSAAVTRALAELSDAALETAADAWLEALGPDASGADAYTLGTLLGELRAAVRDRAGDGARVHVLLEERAF